MPTPDEFFEFDVRIGTVRSAEPHPKARKPAYILTIDFGELGTKTTSAQITDHYKPDELIGRQVVAVTNFPPRRVAGVKSEVLVLGGVLDAGDVIVLQPTHNVPNGTRVA